VRDQLLTGYFCSVFSPSLRFLRALRRFIIKESWLIVLLTFNFAIANSAVGFSWPQKHSLALSFEQYPDCENAGNLVKKDFPPTCFQQLYKGKLHPLTPSSQNTVANFS
jgi:hypothetical protein